MSAKHHITPMRTYVFNIIALTALMTLTVVAAKWDTMNFGNPNGLNLVIAVVIAIMKAGLVVSIFMGVKYASRLVQLFAAGGFIWLIIFFAFVFGDYANPSDKWGTPYGDSAAPGASPLTGELAVSPKFFPPVDPDAAAHGHAGGSGDDGHGAAAVEDHGDADGGTEPAIAGDGHGETGH